MYMQQSEWNTLKEEHMKRASTVLGIVAGIIGLGGAFRAFWKIKALSSIATPETHSDIANLVGLEPSNAALINESYIALVIVIGVLCTVGSILGIAGGILVGKNSGAASALMATGGILNALSDLHIAVIILSLLGGIFALTGDNQGLPQQKNGGAFAATAKLLGITGGAVALLQAALYLYIHAIDAYYIGDAPMDIGLILLAAIGGAAAVAGGLLAKQRRTLAGLLMLIGAIATVFGLSGTFPLILLLVGGVFAFVFGGEPVAKPARLDDISDEGVPK